MFYFVVDGFLGGGFWVFLCVNFYLEKSLNLSNNYQYDNFFVLDFFLNYPILS